MLVDGLHGVHDIAVGELVSDPVAGEENYIVQAEDAREPALLIHHGQTPHLLRPHSRESCVDVILRMAEEHLGYGDVSHQGIASLCIASSQRDRYIAIRDHADGTAILDNRKGAAAVFPKDLCNGCQIRFRTAESNALYHYILDIHNADPLWSSP